MNKFIFILIELLRYLKIFVKTGALKRLNQPKYNIIDTQECYIFGNGPSLNESLKISDNFFLNRNLIVVNDFVLSPFYKICKPKYYVFADPAFWAQDLPTHLSERINKVKNELINATEWEIYVIIPFAGISAFKEISSSNNNIKLMPFNNTPLETGASIDAYFYSKNLAAPHIQNVLVAAIFSAINIGFKKIYLLGADHSWLNEMCVNHKNEVCLKDKHFYKVEGDVKLEPWKKLDGTIFSMTEILEALKKMFRGYSILQKYATLNGSTIYNCTPGSFIDAFERVADFRSTSN